VISHDPEVVAWADRIVMLQDGRVVAPDDRCLVASP
jgi:hypothetical protein